MDSNHRSCKAADLQSAPFGHSGIHPLCFQSFKELSFRRACGRIRTADQLITNQLLWPTELHRQVGRLTESHRSTFYLCCGQALEDSKGAGRTGPTRFAFATAKVRPFFDFAITKLKILPLFFILCANFLIPKYLNK